MLKRFRLIPCFLMDIIKKGYSRFELCTKDSGLEKGETLSCLFESFALIVGKDTLDHHIRVFNFKFKVGKKCRLGQVGAQPSRSSFIAKIKQIKKLQCFTPNHRFSPSSENGHDGRSLILFAEALASYLHPLVINH